MRPWELIDERPLHDGDRCLVRRRFARGDGGEAGFDIMLEGPGAVVLALTTDDRVVLVRQFRPGPREILLDLPAGFLDGDEHPEDSARRELEEETGYVAGDIASVGRLTPDPYSDEVRHVFVATDCRPVGERDTDPTEEIEVALVTLPELRRLLREGALVATDAAYLALDSIGAL